MNPKIFLFTLITLALTLSSCIYKMPDEDSYSLIPKTNNPVFIGESDQNTMPNQANF